LVNVLYIGTEVEFIGLV